MRKSRDGRPAANSWPPTFAADVEQERAVTMEEVVFGDENAGDNLVETERHPSDHLAGMSDFSSGMNRPLQYHHHINVGTRIGVGAGLETQKNKLYQPVAVMRLKPLPQRGQEWAQGIVHYRLVFYHWAVLQGLAAWSNCLA